MSNLLWPGDHRAGALMSDHAFFDALVTVENAWLATLIEAGVAPPDAATDLAEILGADDIESTAVGSERDGNPVTGLVALLRERAGTATARWIHRGLTSQDVVDSALALCLRDALNVVREQLSGQIATVLGLVEKYRDRAVLTHTLTQPALPGTGGRRFSVWLTALLDAADTLATLPPLPVQSGGAAGTMAAATELTGSAEAALALTESLAGRVGLTSAMPWHTTRSVPTRVGDALVGCTDAWGHLANDIALGCRAEIGEYTEGSGGGSSTMPHKSNPALSVLVRRAALAAPALGATLHTASAASVDERADGGWHAEWDTVRILTRRTVVAALQTSDLLTHLHFDADRAEANLAAAEGLLAEQRAMTELTGRQADSSYLGATELLTAATLQRARHHLKEKM